MSCDNWSRTLGGWLAGCGAATAVFGTFTLVLLAIVSGGSLSRFVGSSIALLFPLLLIFVVTCLLTGIPAAAAIWLSERFRIRSMLFFGCIGAAIGLLSQNLLLQPAAVWLPRVGWLFLVAGFAAGVTYWFVAGKYAGGDRHLPGNTA